MDEQVDTAQHRPDPAPRRRAQSLVAAGAVAAAALSIGFRVVQGLGLEQTSMLFIGLPAVLAIIVAGTAPARTATGTILKTSTICLLLAGTLLGETLICLVMAAPLVYLVGLCVGAPIDRARRARARGDSTTAHHAALALVLLAGLEGVVPGVAAPRMAEVTVTRHIAAPPAAVAAALSGRPAFDHPRPTVLRIGFPRAIAASGSGLDIGDRRTIVIRGAGHHGTTHTGRLVMAVTDREPGAATFTTVTDTSRVADWLAWHDSVVCWQADGDGTRVSWTVRYERELTPSWYFGPLQRGAVTLSAGYLIDSLATP